MSGDQDHHPDYPGRLERILLRRVNVVRKILVAVIALLIFREVASGLANLLGAAPALIGGILVIAVQLVCSHLARANLRYYSYIFIPTLLFTIVPAALKIRAALNFQEQTPAARLWIIAPEVVSFVLPVLLLLVAYWLVSRKVPRDPKAGK